MEDQQTRPADPRKTANPFKEALQSGEFVITCEIIPGRGAYEDSQEKEFEEARSIYATGRVHAISITDNPSGNPALLADTLGGELRMKDDVETLVHFTCKDRSRNQMMSQLYSMERSGVQNILFMTGDYQQTAWSGRARPVFDLDSVHVQMLAKQMNDGLQVPTIKGVKRENKTHFFCGGVVNPFKYTEGEAVTQYLKMEKKIIAGAQFLIAQVGYDARKLEELKIYLEQRGYSTPLIANIFLLTRGAAKLMRKGTIAGCTVTEELLAVLEEEAKADDKGKGARIERAAQMIAIAKGLGYAGVHIGGFGVNAEMVCKILDRADELAPTWRELVPGLSFGVPGGYYFYGAQVDEQGKPTGLNDPAVLSPTPELAHSKKVFSKWGLSKFFHYWVLTLDKRGGKILAKRMDGLDRKKGFYRHHGLEHTGKAMIYNCMDCGDCGLEACLYTCPMTQCPKCQRNGPCGGSMDGWCEVFPGERYCIWYKAYHKAKKDDRFDRITTFITPPNHWEYFGSSPWSNYTHRRDNGAFRIPVSLGLGGAPGGVLPETDLGNVNTFQVPESGYVPKY